MTPSVTRGAAASRRQLEMQNLKVGAPARDVWARSCLRSGGRKHRSKQNPCKPVTPVNPDPPKCPTRPARRFAAPATCSTTYIHTLPPPQRRSTLCFPPGCPPTLFHTGMETRPPGCPRTTRTRTRTWAQPVHTPKCILHGGLSGRVRGSFHALVHSANVL